MGRGRWSVALAAALLAAAYTRAAPAQPAYSYSAPTDSALLRFMDSLADSSDRFFGLSSAPPDTAGLDSTLAYYLEHPEAVPRERRAALGWPVPDYRYNRVDGSYFGARAGAGNALGAGRLEGRVGYANGPDEWLGGLHLIERRGTRRALWTLDVGWDKATERLDPGHRLAPFYWLRALVNGSDRTHYLRREGARVQLRRDAPHSSAYAAYGDQREAPLEVTSLWNLFNRSPAVQFNLPARPGRVRAYGFGAGVELGPWPLGLWLENETASRALGSNFDYHRWRGAAGAVVPTTRWAGLALQAEYGAVREDAVPQAAFLLGGSHSLRSLPGFSLAGTRTAQGRAELILAPDLLQLSRLAHPAFLNLQAGVTAAVGSVWGTQPFTGEDLGGGTWPDRRDWRSEVGAALLYRPGLPDPWGFFRADVAWPVGNHSGPRRLTLSYVQVLHLLPRIGR